MLRIWIGSGGVSVRRLRVGRRAERRIMVLLHWFSFLQRALSVPRRIMLMSVGWGSGSIGGIVVGLAVRPETTIAEA